MDIIVYKIEMSIIVYNNIIVKYSDVMMQMRIAKSL